MVWSMHVTRLSCCYLIFVKVAMFKVHGAVLPHAKGSTRDWFGKGMEKEDLFGKDWTDVVVSG